MFPQIPLQSQTVLETMEAIVMTDKHQMQRDLPTRTCSLTQTFIEDTQVHSDSGHAAGAGHSCALRAG